MKFHALCVMMTALTWGVKAMSSNTRGVRGNLTDPSEGQSKHDCARRPPAEFGSILAQKANLTVSKANEGTLTISGPSVAKIRILADRPVRLSRSVDTAIFILQFKRTFATGAPNAVLSGVTEGGELREVTIVLETAEYFALPTIPPFVTFAWKSDDEEIDQNLELQSATLFIDSFWERTECIRKHARAGGKGGIKIALTRNNFYEIPHDQVKKVLSWVRPRGLVSWTRGSAFYRVDLPNRGPGVLTLARNGTFTLRVNYFLRRIFWRAKTQALPEGQKFPYSDVTTFHNCDKCPSLELIDVKEGGLENNPEKGWKVVGITLLKLA